VGENVKEKDYKITSKNMEEDEGEERRCKK
jgi:hypothetical protein